MYALNAVADWILYALRVLNAARQELRYLLHRAWLGITQRRAIRGITGLLATFCITLAALHPAVFAALPAGTEIRTHLYRLIALDQSIQYGNFWPRYSPGLLYGYGMPLFNFISPLAYYPAELLHLAGLNFSDALLVSAVLAVIAGGFGAFLLGHAWGGPAAGIIAAAAFVYAPYTLSTWMQRGEIPELMALAVSAWCLWAFWQTAMHGRWHNSLLAALLFSVLLLLHIPTALFSIFVTGIYTLIMWWVSPDPRKSFVRLSIAFLAPIGLTAFYWLPAVAELRYIHIERAAQITEILSNLRGIPAIFTLPHTADQTRLRANIPQPLGVIQAALFVTAAVVTAVFRLRKDPALRHIFHTVFFAIIILSGLVLLMLPLSSPIWQILPPMFLPERASGIASVILAPMAGVGLALGIRLTGSPLLRALMVFFVVSGIMLYGMPWVYNAYLPEQRAATIIDAQNYERTAGFAPRESASAAIPWATQQLPDPDRLTGLYALTDAIPRMQPSDSVVVTSQQWSPVSGTISFNASARTEMTFDWVNYPGWQAMLDGQETGITSAEPHGLISITVPKGQHTLSLSFGKTRLRAASEITSLASFVLVIVLTAALRIWRKPWEITPRSDIITWQQAGLIIMAAAAAGIMLLVLKSAVFDNNDTFIKRTRFADNSAPAVDYPVGAVFGGNLALPGYDLDKTTYRSGQSFEIRLYWTVQNTMVAENYARRAVIRDSEGNIVSQSRLDHPGGVRTSAWVPGFYVQDDVLFSIPHGTPPGVYSIDINLINPASGQSLDVRDNTGTPAGVLANIAALTIEKPRRSPPLQRLVLDETPSLRINDDLRFIGGSKLPETALVGQQLPVVWYWEARRTPETDYTVRVTWLDENGSPAGSSRLVEPTAAFPTSLWEKQDIWRGLHLLYIPGELEAGQYTVAIEVFPGNEEDPREPAIIGEMSINTPQRSYDIPDMQIVAEEDWVNGIQLLGYDLEDATIAQGNGVRITLYWQAQDTIDRDLTVFALITDEDGNTYMRWEQKPASGERPTPSWAPGEIITDRYGLLISRDVPPGNYRVYVGLLDARTGEVVLLNRGSDRWLIPHVISVRSAE